MVNSFFIFFQSMKLNTQLITIFVVFFSSLNKNN